MKKTLTFLLFFALILCACDKDEDSINYLQYDGDNASSPILPAGTYELAARFPASITRLYDGQALSSIEFLVYEVPLSLEVVIYGPGANADIPGPIIHEALLSGVGRDSWNIYELDTPIILGNSELWISIRFTTNASEQTIGCDAGPRNANGDRMYTQNDNTWQTFLDFAPGESINWNIRGVITP
ncbi:MAG: hypothetical protein KJP00_09150 [Bacteroidia bacterium]|nr:hypothetical protein [Bacteroidia bacterium]